MSYQDTRIMNLNDVEDQRLTRRDRWADVVVRVMGSWKFIAIQTTLLGLWSILNILAFFEHWDPYPFILLNLILSLQSAYAAPIIMMSQNRQSARDRLEAHHDYVINIKSEKEIRTLLNHLEEQNKMIRQLHSLLLSPLHQGSNPTLERAQPSEA